MENRGIKIETMEKVLLDIYGIKDIEEIMFKDLMPMSTAGSKLNVLPSLYITYDGGKYMILSQQDPYFDIFVKKVFEVYMKEKDREFVDPARPFHPRQRLKIDDKTKSILETGDLTRLNEIYSSFKDKKCYEHSLIFPIDEVRLMLPIFKYHLKELLDRTNLVIQFVDGELTGYRRHFSIPCKIDGIDDVLLIKFIKKDSYEYCALIRPMSHRFAPLEMKVELGKYNISVDSYIKEYDLLSSHSYDIKDDGVEWTNRVYKDNQLIIYQDSIMEKADNPYPNVTKLDSNEEMTWYLLPWDAYMGISNKLEKIGELESIVMMHHQYLGIVGNEFILREYYGKVYHRDKTFDKNSNNVVIDEINKRTYGMLLVPKEGIYLLETYFLDNVRSSGFYDAYLRDRYYYHLTESKDGLGDIDRNKLVSISTDNNIIRNADLLVHDDVKKLLRGE